MRLRTIIESDDVVVTKIVKPGEWPARSGVAIPGSVLPWATSDSTVWAQSKYTRDVMEDSLQMTQYLINVPKHYVDQEQAVIKSKSGREWVVNVPCSYELVNILNRPWDPGEKHPLPRNLALIIHGGSWPNWIVSLEHGISDQITQLASWAMDDIEDLSVSDNEVSYHSSQMGEYVRHSIKIFP